MVSDSQNFYPPSLYELSRLLFDSLRKRGIAKILKISSTDFDDATNNLFTCVDVCQDKGKKCGQLYSCMNTGNQ